MQITAISFTASKTVQEQRFEPLKLQVTVDATLPEGANVDAEMEVLQNFVYEKLDNAFRIRARRAEENAKRLEEMKRKSDAMAEAVKRGDPYYAGDQEWP